MQKIKISKVPKIKYLNKYVNNSLENAFYIEIINIILNYFVQCNHCNNYFEDTILCKCPLNWCKYCAHSYMKDKCCNKCITENNLNNDILLYTCLIKNCNHWAKFGSIQYPFYCKFHASSKLLVCYQYKCSINNCLHIAIHCDKYFNSFCKNHFIKDTKYMLILSEGFYYKNKYKKNCESCNKKTSLLYECDCKMKRCTECSGAEVFKLYNNDTKIYNIHCSVCCISFNYDDNKVYNYDLYKLCAIYNCNEEGIFYNEKENNYYCPTHNNNCVGITARCSHNYCYAIPSFLKYKNKYFCKYHKAEYIQKYD
jgi:hypothetical protein